jgi:uncharacterized membrane protein YbaN (DUF454 family)
MRKSIWFTLGILFLGIAFIGIIIPGIPWSTPAVVAAFCFSQSSTKMHHYIHSHPIFGPFLKGWSDKKIFPTKAKQLMLITMTISLIIAWFTIKSWIIFNIILILMIGTLIWGWRYPGSEEEYNRRKNSGQKIAWLK